MTGWTEAALAQTSQHVRDGLAWILFARSVADTATLDVETPDRDIREARVDIAHRKSSEETRVGIALRRLGEQDSRLSTAKAKRERVRKILWPPDEAEA